MADGAPRGWTWLSQDGALVFADVGWDDTGVWSESVLQQLSLCHAFLPNAQEAMAYTRTDTPRDALYALADRVPLAVVTNGIQGAMAIDATTGEEAEVPGLRVNAIDPTGAGDVFAAGMILGTLRDWPLVDRLAFASGLFGAGSAAVRWVAGGPWPRRRPRLVALRPRGRTVAGAYLRLAEATLRVPRRAGTGHAGECAPAGGGHHRTPLGCRGDPVDPGCPHPSGRRPQGETMTTPFRAGA